MAETTPYEPIRPRPNIPLKQRVIVAALFAVLAIGLIWWVMTVIASNNPFGQYVEPGRSDTIAAQFGQGGPVFLRDLAGRGNDLYVLHEGTDHNQGWTAVGVFVPNSQNCIVQWNMATEQFEAEILDEGKPATGCVGLVFPASGEGLNHYPIWSDKNHLKIDVNFAERDEIQRDEEPGNG